MGSDRSPRRIGLAIVGAGRIGLIRGEIAARHPSVGWIGIAETRADRGKQVAERLGADFVTTDFRELLRRPPRPSTSPRAAASRSRFRSRRRTSTRDQRDRLADATPGWPRGLIGRAVRLRGPR